MTTLALTHRPSKAASGRSLLSIAAMVANHIRWRMKVRADRRQLQAFPDYLLSDIGITRGEIENATRHGRSGLGRVLHPYH